MEPRPIEQVFKNELETYAQHENLVSQIDIRIPCRPAEGVPIELTEQIARWAVLGFKVALLKDHMGGFIEVVRAHIAHTYLAESDKKYLLMVDSDVIPRLDLPLLLARHNRPVVGAPVPITLRDHGPTLNFTIPDGKGGHRFPSFSNHSRIPSRGLLPVQHIGTGAMLIRRDVLEAFTWQGEDVPFMVPGDLRAEGLRKGNLRRGEDMEFCNQVRAKGFDVYADMEARASHRKMVPLEVPDALLDPTMDPAGWTSTEAEYLVGG